ncbi:bypass of stop codon protein 6 [Aspergillus udagawae]|uniref:Bypass of stop codon protein 6 n=1 Tax=Aspergillus udagawae TaxID=91492 RepID=A0ABQ1AK39_9EURO|nr:bypass of stop codon protein 6 [Aspergillus udagawae]GFF83381.1 bypass of stop codon protein 6 [Aspergillus udagawae]GFG20658.1 bypass of stop codon protein 6 [Aspergillus udagawae]
MSRNPPSDDPTTPLLQSAVAKPIAGADQTLGSQGDVDGELRWNESVIQAWRVLATFFCFIVVGANDGTYGALVPYLCDYYELDYAAVSVVFLSPCVGYVAAALVSNWTHEHFGQRGVALLGSACHIVAYVACSQHPPYPILVSLFVLAGLGNGVLDAAWNAWIGVMAQSSRLMGILHGFYGLGAALAPLAATSLITSRGWHWYQYYYLMVGGATIETVTLTIAFWSARGASAKVELHQSNGNRTHTKLSWRETLRGSPTIQSLESAATWIICLFIFIYAGIEITLGGWVFTYLVRQRGIPPFAAGMANFAYWAGLTSGRVLLGFLTTYLQIGQYTVIVYVAACLAFHFVFWLVEETKVSVAAVALLGFFLGPLFPEAVIALAHRLPKHLHIAGIGIAVALGSAGGCVFPFITGALAKVAGIQILQPMVLGMLVLCLLSWIVFTSMSRREPFR